MVGMIMKAMIMTALLMGSAMAACARDVSGTVTSGKRPMAEVIITDGLHFTVTDKNGHYKLDAPDDAKFVYLLTPRGYVADYSSGTPQFYKPLQQGTSRYDFELYKMDGDASKTVMIAATDPQLDTEHGTRRLFAETLPDIKQLLTKYPGRQKAGFMAGDLTWDVYKNNADVKRFARESDIPFYPVIGNHDYDKYMVPAEGADYAHRYEDDFGPTYYAFQFGDTYYVILNDIKYTGNKRYTLSLELGHQMAWVAELLNVVLQQDNNVSIVMHAPLRLADGSGFIDGGKQLVDMLLAKPFRAAVFTGHTHLNAVWNIGNGIYEYNTGAMCGYWWTSDVAGDGTPNGYRVVTADGQQWQQFYKATNHDTDYQFEIYPVGTFADRPDAVCCKVWNWDDRWTVRYSEDGQPRGRMSQFNAFAPEYLRYLDGRIATIDYTPKRVDHYFSAVPSPGAKTVTVEVEDAYGNVFTKSISLK